MSVNYTKPLLCKIICPLLLCLDVELLQVTATDQDGLDNTISYVIVENYNSSTVNFTIDGNTGVISRVSDFEIIREAGTVKHT